MAHNNDDTGNIEHHRVHKKHKKLSAFLDGEVDSDDDLQLASLFPTVLMNTEENNTSLSSSFKENIENDEINSPSDLSKTKEFICIECDAHVAQVFCEQCHDYFCVLCYGGQHRKGKRKLHTFQNVMPQVEIQGNENTSRKSINAEEDENSIQDSNDSDDSDEEIAGDNLYPNDSKHNISATNTLSQPTTTHGRNVCDMVGHFFLGSYYDAYSRHSYQRLSAPESNAPVQKPVLSETAKAMLERAKYIPVRLTYEERKRLRVLEATLSVSNYTDKLDTIAFAENPSKRVRTQLQDICGFLSALVVGCDYRVGQMLLDDKSFDDKLDFFQEIFELGRRYKIMNPEKMRGDYGKLMYFLQDTALPHIQELLGFSCHQKIRTVYDVLEEANSLGVLSHPKIELATMVVAPEGKTRTDIQRQIKKKERAIQEITHKFTSARLDRDELQQCLYSIADNNYHLYFERDPIDRMIQLLQEYFSPTQNTETESTSNSFPHYSLAIVSGEKGSRLSHSHSKQYYYVLQSLTLWREIVHDFFRLWYLTDEDLLTNVQSSTNSTGTPNPYKLEETGQGLHRIQSAPRVSRAMHVILHSTQQRLANQTSGAGEWVGSSVIHLGDRNVPNALMFVDKYTQIGHILRPIVKTIETIDKLCSETYSVASDDDRHKGSKFSRFSSFSFHNSSKNPTFAGLNTDGALKDYIDTTFGGPETLKRTILADFFREAFDGSGADNFFEAGSCIDGRLTSAWNWCSNLHTKAFFPIFKLAGFVGFDGKFG